MNYLLLAGLNNAAWAAALAVVVAIIARFVHRRPAMVHALWLLVLLKLVTPSLITIETGRWITGPRTGEDAPQRNGGDRINPSSALAGTFSRGEKVEEMHLSPRERSAALRPGEGAQRNGAPARKLPAETEWPWQPIVATLWLLGSIVWASALVLGMVRFRRLLRSAEPASDELRRKVESIAKTLELRWIPTTVIVPACIPPMLWALVGRPTLILPQALWERLDDDERDAILAHELAHLKRRDEWARRLEAVALGLYWWNPVAWWARREVERAEEQCCDAWVLWALPGASAAYAQALVRTADFLSDSKSRHPWPAGASGAGHFPPLKRRLSMILNAERVGSIPKPHKVPRTLAAFAMLCLLALPAWALSERQKAEPITSGQIASALQSVHRQAADVVVDPKPAEKPPALDAPPEIADKVKFVQVTSGETQDYQFFRGNLEPADPIAVIAPQAASYRSLVSTGTVVAKDVPIFEFGQARHGDLSEAESEIDRLKKELTRIKQIAKSPTSDPAIQMLANELKVALDRKDWLDPARLQEIKAPIRGSIQLLVDADEAPAGADARMLLANITPMDSLRVAFHIDQTTFLKLKRQRLKTGRPSAIDIGSPLEATIGGNSDRNAGQIVSVESKFDPKTGTLRCRASIPNPDGLFIPGMSATVKIATSDPHKAVFIPHGAIRQNFGEPFVCWVLNEQGIVEQRQIAIKDASKKHLEVTSGLKEGDWVVTGGQDRLKPGLKVKR